MTRGVVRKYGINVLNIDIGIKSLTRTLLMLVTHGSNVVATITMVLMPARSTSTTTMAMPTTTTGFVLRWWPRLQYIRLMSSVFNIQGYYKY